MRWSLAALLLIATGAGAAGPVHWFDGKRERSAWPSATEVVLFEPVGESGGEPAPADEKSAVTPREAAPPGARLIRRLGRLALYRIEAGARARTALPENAAPVFHPRPEGGPRMAPTGNLKVLFESGWDREAAEAWGLRHGLRLLRPLSSHRPLYLFQGAGPMAALEQARRLRGAEVVYAAPEWWYETFIK